MNITKVKSQMFQVIFSMIHNKNLAIQLQRSKEPRHMLQQ